MFLVASDMIVFLSHADKKPNNSFLFTAGKLKFVSHV